MLLPRSTIQTNIEHLLVNLAAGPPHQIISASKQLLLQLSTNHIFASADKKLHIVYTNNGAFNTNFSELNFNFIL